MNEALLREQVALAGLPAFDVLTERAGSTRRLHSKYDPWKEARAQLAAEPDRDRVVLVFGAGYGYVVRLMLDQGLSVVWFETDQSLLQEGLGLLDFREELRSRRLRIGVSIDSPQIEQWRLSNENVAFWSHRSFLTPELSREKGKAEFLLNRQSVNHATLARFERLWAVNLCGNLISLRSAQPVKNLFGAHVDCAAVVIGAGPSLTDSLTDLASVRGRAVFVAVDTAVRVLAHAGIDPDYIVTVDPQPVNRVFLEGYRGRASIVVDPTVSQHTARYAARGRTYVAATPFHLGRLFAKMLGGEPGEIAFGGSVSTNAYDLARKMGCDPVYLVGQDLAFSDGQVHARGAALEERLSWKESRTWRREIHNYAQLTAIPPLTVEDLRGGLSQTNGKLAIFYRWFETRFESDARTGLDVVNCTTRGALFKRVRQGELQELAARVGSPELDVGPDTVTHSVLKQVREIRENLASINSAYQEAWRLTEPSRRSDALDVLGEMLRRMPELELLGNTAQKAIQQLGRGDIGESPEQLHRALHNGCELLLRSLGRVERVIRDLQAPGS